MRSATWSIHLFPYVHLITLDIRLNVDGQNTDWYLAPSSLRVQHDKEPIELLGNLPRASIIRQIIKRAHEVISVSIEKGPRCNKTAPMTVRFLNVAEALRRSPTSSERPYGDVGSPWPLYQRLDIANPPRVVLCSRSAIGIALRSSIADVSVYRRPSNRAFHKTMNA